MNTSINGRTKVIGIFGYPVEHSFSPAMHNAAFRHMGLNCVYVPFPVKPENVARAVDGIRGMGLAGVNVTIPHKSAVIAHLDEIDLSARLIGAVNTIVNEDGVLKGYNTDAPGFVKSLTLDAGVSPQGKRVFILGAGGAARAVSIQLALAGVAEIIFSSPAPQEIPGLRETITGAAQAQVREVPWGEEYISAHTGDIDILINATPVGMHPNAEQMPPVNPETLPGNCLVCDLIYNPRVTALLRAASEKGLPTLNGMGMLLYQGAIAYKLWTGSEPPLEVMRKALEEAI